MKYVLQILLAQVLTISMSSPVHAAVMPQNLSRPGQVTQQAPFKDLSASVKAQSRLLVEINRAYADGQLSSEQADYLWRAVDTLGEQVDQCLAMGKPMPADFISQESSELSHLQQQLDFYVKRTSASQFKGSAQLQEQVTATVDKCLSQGKITPEKAAEIKTIVNRFCAEECWNLRNGDGAIPKTLIDSDTKELNVLDGQLQKTLIGSGSVTAL